MKVYIDIHIILFIVALFSCSSKNTTEGNDPILHGNDYVTAKITIDKSDKHAISSDLFGYNIVYAETPDRAWNNGVIENFTKETKTSFIRYPGGTVVTYWHWKEPTGNGWDDIWNPEYNMSSKPSSDFMDIDEYISLVNKFKINPLIGININSGYKYNRLNESVNEALDLMNYCKDKGLNVEYWYLGNEPYRPDCNGGPLTVEQYADLINIFANAMRKNNPSVKLIANWHSNFTQQEKDYIKLLKLAGQNIDIFDVHHYWNWSTASLDGWLKKTPIGLWTGQSYIEDIKKFREIAQKNGYPDIKLATLEWNAGPGKESEERLNVSQNAFVQCEMMMQFMLGGMDIATFWPLFWRSGQFNERGIYNIDSGKLNPNSLLLKELSQFSSTQSLGTAIEGKKDNLLYLCVEDPDAKSLKGCILNKNGEPINIKIVESGITSNKPYSVRQYTLENSNSLIQENITAKSELKSKELIFNILPYSIVFFETH